MQVRIPHQISMVQRQDLEDTVTNLTAPSDSSEKQIWVNDELTEQERGNLAVLNNFWLCWKTFPLDINRLGHLFAPDVTVRTGWRGEHVVHGREQVLDMYAQEIERQTARGEISDFRFPVVIAKGPVIFHTWIWITQSKQLGYHIERPMAASYLITNGQIERWDSYCTGLESEPGYAGGNGPDGL
ncbi:MULTISPECIES: hypothetical protein [Paraburkholderia]|uniref:Nuclear transport factor 2 family protein n=1 Tax=Paraburkholderia dipogonis TaxID=1211383 RepID=A0A4Y8MH26_9BURK|nr:MULTISPECIES: hypothetical protein [Paraburkholderia]RKR31285.1 hypothetical protein B0G82_7425 [Paraburkholderia sp. BL17N1]TFE36741.1 hypothetical protein E2553_44590 [Paraburkholderia dipogonis]